MTHWVGVGNQSKLPTYIVDNEKNMTNPEKNSKYIQQLLCKYWNKFSFNHI